MAAGLGAKKGILCTVRSKHKKDGARKSKVRTAWTKQKGTMQKKINQSE